MNDALLGYGVAFITILLFGSWAVPTKALKIEPGANAFWLTVGHCILSLALFSFVRQAPSFQDFLLALFAGILWGGGIFAGFYAIKQLGITRALGIWVPVVVITSALWGLLFFHEAQKMGRERVLLSLGAIIILIVAALMIIASMKGEKPQNKNLRMRLGILAAVTLGICHGSFFVPLQASTSSTVVTFVPLTLGMVLATGILAWKQKVPFKYPAEVTFRMLLGGFLLGGGNYMALVTTHLLGVAQGYPLTQLAIIVNTLWGMLVFKEVTSKKSKLLIAIGIVTALIGAIVLNWARL